MFCTYLQCNEFLCSSCSLQDHANHKLIGINENVHESTNTRDLHQEIVKEQDLLREVSENLKEAKSKLLQEAETSQTAIDRKINSIANETETMKMYINKYSQEQIETLEVIQLKIRKYNFMCDKIRRDILRCDGKISSESTHSVKRILNMRHSLTNKLVNCKFLRFEENKESLGTLITEDFSHPLNISNTNVGVDFLNYVEK